MLRRPEKDSAGCGFDPHGAHKPSQTTRSTACDWPNWPNATADGVQVCRSSLTKPPTGPPVPGLRGTCRPGTLSGLWMPSWCVRGRWGYPPYPASQSGCVCLRRPNVPRGSRKQRGTDQRMTSPPVTGATTWASVRRSTSQAAADPMSAGRPNRPTGTADERRARMSS